MKSIVCGVLGWTALLSGNALAADPTLPVAGDVAQVEVEGWTFKVAPYFWAARLSGEVGSFGLPTIDVDASFSDIFDNLDFGAMAMADAQYGRYTIFGDAMYIKVSNSSGTPLGICLDSVEVSSTTFSGLIGGGYALVDTPDARLEVVGGARLWSVDTKISLDGGFLDGASVSDGDTWVDGLAGLRGNYSFTPNVYATAWGLVGAGQADLDWDVAAVLGYRFNDKVSAVLGYRAIGVDYENDSFVFDIVEQGPIIGAVINF